MRSKNLWQVALLENWQRGGFGVYVHWPFCEAKCPYCDFNSHVARSIDHDAWSSAYEREIERWAKRLGPRTLSSIFFGGGTPSLMLPSTVDAVVSALGRHFPFSNQIEITLEANPSSVEAQKFRDFHSAGINRVSLGIQALNDQDLKALGRLHSKDDALSALEIARSVFARVSFDIIYARQNQSLDAWQQELSEILTMGMDHLSLYQLTIEDGTAFGDRYAVGKLKGLPDDDLSADQFELTQALCERAGFTAYEVSNHAKPGLESHHNLIYWQGGDYLGIGPGAHGRVSITNTRYATEGNKNPNMWLQTALKQDAWTETKLDDNDIIIERLLMGLRINKPLQVPQSDKVINRTRLDDMVCQGLITHNEDGLCLTPKGRPLLNAVLSELIAD